ncbi:MAG: hypothetical protein KAW09_01875, partial [Thermoplasmata archaeon]|nr:hypothetical protein [Thermoplasmata archaeon]
LIANARILIRSYKYIIEHKQHNKAAGILICVVELMKHYRIRRSVKWDDRGVASTVGTIMSLLVFLTFMSLIVDQYVPAWMKDAESAHMNEAFGQFGDLKNNVDSQVLACQMARLVGQPCMRVTTFTPITLGVDGVPLFSSPTAGVLQMNAWEGNTSVEFSYQAGNFTWDVNSSSGGNIDLQVYNRYYVPQRVIYENGAVLVYQVDGQLVGIAPHFIIDNRTKYMEISLSQVTLLGSGGTSGVSTEGVRSRLVTAESERYLNLTSDFNFTLLTDYEKAWFHFYNDTLFEVFSDPAILEMSGSPTN